MLFTCAVYECIYDEAEARLLYAKRGNFQEGRPLARVSSYPSGEVLVNQDEKLKRSGFWLSLNNVFLRFTFSQSVTWI